MKKSDDLIKLIQTIPMVFLGNAVYALGVKLFLLPGNLIVGGTTGIALIVNHLVGLEISDFVLIFNIFMLVAGYVFLGKKFAFTTILSSVFYPFTLKFYNHIFHNIVLTDDKMLASIFSGLLIGIGLGLVIRMGASTGGMDIPPLILHKYLNTSVSVAMYVFDVIILLGQVYFQSMDALLYGLIIVLIYTTVLNKMMINGTQRTEIKIISNYYQDIKDAILTDVDRGVTMISAKGGFSGEETEMVFTVISNRELPKIERIVREIDENAFLIITHVNEVRGRGFTQKKRRGSVEKVLD